MRIAAKLSLLALIFTSIASGHAIKVSTVLGSGGGTFDPWNTTRWSAWYSGGKLAHPFEIDCNVTFENRGGSSSPWRPDVSVLVATDNMIFTVVDSGRGITINGNGQYVDIRNDAYRGYSLAELYSNRKEIFLIDYCVRFEQGLDSSKPATVIRNLVMKGFVQGIRTGRNQRHPLTIENCTFRRNQWGVYLSGAATTVTGCDIAETSRGGMYLGSGAHDDIVTGNTFRDNDYRQSAMYGDIAMDTSYNMLIENNQHVPSTVSTRYYHCGIKMYRNMGEGDSLRESTVHYNTIRGNFFNGYSVAYEVGSRQGDASDNDISYEGHDYASYNLFENNTITNTTIGIKLNCPANTIRGNTFTNVVKPIVLHCVFYSLTENVINDQAGDNVYYWFKAGDYSAYSTWFPYQAGLTAGIAEALKFIHVRSDYGAPNFQNYTGPATVVKAPSLIIDSANHAPDLTSDQLVNMLDFAVFGNAWKKTNPFPDQTDLNFDGSTDAKDLGKIAEKLLLNNDLSEVQPTGAVAIDIAVGDFWVEWPGEEIAVIWDTPISNIQGTNYYTITIYDTNGIEINRCGRSLVKWEAITTGNFVQIGCCETSDEIAAVPANAINGYYPIYIFGRGRKDASEIMLSMNTEKIVDLAGGNFRTATDSYDEIAAVYAGGSSRIMFCKPTEASWTATTTGAASLTRIASGNFDGDSSNGDEIAGINATSSQIYFYKPAATTNYATAGKSGLAVWTAITGGEFNNSATRQEVAVASSAAVDGIYPVSYYSQSWSSAFKQTKSYVLAVPAKAISAGSFTVGAKLGMYEQVKGLYSDNYGAVIGNWGQHIAVLPDAVQTITEPIYWLNTNPSNTQQEYLKVMPTFR
ncbi:MAG: hypothetical protein A2Y12_01710 [Planctomycetes bacterium GWF2_42_9]|nr:MAG: hypothetical protein A2Y12_01710 [Planctomycetes bacterium GWF2_42_9]